jgi:HD-GYP domain-containing protein (c-di-GMP phosphodiesterase class II)
VVDENPFDDKTVAGVGKIELIAIEDMVENHQDLMQEITAGLIHDLGKICVSLEILKKSTPVTRTERRILEHHAPAGFVLLSHYFQDTQNLGAKVARDHHERRDGSGYPLGIMLTDRMVEIVAACDIYDALLLPRPYRQTSYDNRTALEEITGMAQKGTLSWEIVQILVAYNRKSKPHYTECTVSREKRGEPPTDNVYGIIAPEPESPPVADEQ